MCKKFVENNLYILSNLTQKLQGIWMLSLISTRTTKLHGQDTRKPCKIMRISTEQHFLFSKTFDLIITGYFPKFALF